MANMRLPDPFTHPHLEGLGFSSCVLTDNDPITRDEMPNGEVREVKMSAQYFSIDIRYPDLLPTEYAVLDAFLLESKRTRSYIEVVLPYYESFRVMGNTALTSIASGQKGSTIRITNTAVLLGTPLPGDLFKLSTHQKVYKITSVTKDSTSWTLGLYPDLRTTTNGSEKPVFTGIKFRTKALNLDTYSSNETADGVFTGMGLNLRES